MSSMEHAQVLKLLERMIALSTQRKVASELGVSEAYLSDVRKGKRNPGDKLLKALGLESRTVYSKTQEN